MKVLQQVLVSLLILNTLQRPNLAFPQTCDQKIEDLSGEGSCGIFYDVEFILTQERSNTVINLKKNYSAEEVDKIKDCCMKLWQFSSSNFADIENASDYPISVFSDLKEKWRQLSFTLYSSYILAKSVQPATSSSLYYTGYYAIAYYIEDIIYKEMTYFFQINLIINGQNNQIISTDLQNLNYLDTCETPQPIYQDMGGINWCLDSSCSILYVPKLLNLNDTFYLRHFIITSGLQQFYLSNTTVYCVGDGLNKLEQPKLINNSIPGQVTLLMTADILWNNAAFQVTSYLSTSMSGAGRLMQVETTTYDPVSANTISLECIKHPKSSKCPTCAEECEANGFAGSSCPECSNSNNLCILFLNILLFIQI